MYIEPSTIIKIYSGVPLDNTYVHTIYFDSLSAQNAYFHGTASILKHTLTKQSYQRVNRGVMRVEIPYEQLYDCNYIAFQNEKFGNKWFYAFLTSVEYVNNATSEIAFELDSLQTYWDEVKLLDSFVEREHSETDNIGDNILLEPVSMGEYFTEDIVQTGWFDDLVIVVATPYEVDDNGNIHSWNDGSDKLNGLPTALRYYAFTGIEQPSPLPLPSISPMSALMGFIRKYGESKDLNNLIVSAYFMPKIFVAGLTPNILGMVKLPEENISREFTFGNKSFNNLGEYIPRNNKLYTSPYNYFVMTTMNGEENQYAYEFFDSSTITFNIHTNLGSNESFKANPKQYKNKTEDYTEGIILDNIPMVAIPINSFTEWLGRNKTRLAIQGITALYNTFPNVAKGLGMVKAGEQMLTPKRQILSAKGARTIAKGYNTAYKATAGGLSTIGDIIAEASIANYGGIKTNGTADSNLELAMGKKDFLYIRKYINPTNAGIIDMFFDLYGYNTCALKIPNRNVREHWTYVKTADVNLEGKCPNDDLDVIASIYNNGITFWNDPSEVGHYRDEDSQQMKSNRPLSEVR